MYLICGFWGATSSSDVEGFHPLLKTNQHKNSSCWQWTHVWRPSTPLITANINIIHRAWWVSHHLTSLPLEMTSSDEASHRSKSARRVWRSRREAPTPPQCPSSLNRSKTLSLVVKIDPSDPLEFMILGVGGKPLWTACLLMCVRAWKLLTIARSACECWRRGPQTAWDNLSVL